MLGFKGLKCLHHLRTTCNYCLICFLVLQRDFPRPRYGGYGGMSGRCTSKTNGGGSAFGASRGRRGRYKMPCMLQFWHCLKGNAKYREMKQRTKPSGTNSVSRIDRFSRVFFPLTFSVFQVLYWLAYFDFSNSEPYVS